MKKVISDDELKGLLAGLIKHGEGEFYSQMKSRALFIMSGGDKTVDEIFMDVSDTVLEKARAEEDESIKKDCYKVSFIMRRVAHCAYRQYIKEGEQRISERFLRVVD